MFVVECQIASMTAWDVPPYVSNVAEMKSVWTCHNWKMNPGFVTKAFRISTVPMGSENLLNCGGCWKAGNELCTPILMSLVTLLISALKATSCICSFGDHNLMKTIYFIFPSRRLFSCVPHTHCSVLCWLNFLENPVQKLSCHNSSETLNKSIGKVIWL